MLRLATERAAYFLLGWAGSGQEASGPRVGRRTGSGTGWGWEGSMAKGKNNPSWGRAVPEGSENAGGQ